MNTRLTKTARREQLLDVALGLVRTRGVDGLTLVTLAEAAGVSRPIVYDHFGTRAGLLLALYRDLDERHRLALEAAIRDAPATIDAIASVISASYFACTLDLPEFAPLSAALKGNPELEPTQHELLTAYTATMAAALSPYSELSPEGLHLRCTALLGAAEALATELTHNRATASEAIAALTDLITGQFTTR
ncbi:TetR/AcrR family transcriptional regulator [Kribbella sp. NPDC051620]|uniref:TetR/AcrR family transcriptional regulator n=1 Tax=Kribbella sp. NPDC051620 TaxID=3364120 RepID=UPI0037AA6D50